MKKWLLLLLLLLPPAAGCTVPPYYLENRLNDLADIVNADVGAGIGADLGLKATDLLHLELGLAYTRRVGARYGHVGTWHETSQGWIFFHENLKGPSPWLAAPRREDFTINPEDHHCVISPFLGPWFFPSEFEGGEAVEIVPASYDVEVYGTFLFFGGRLGVNLFELVDFFAGLFNEDLAGDDHSYPEGSPSVSG